MQDNQPVKQTLSRTILARLVLGAALALPVALSIPLAVPAAQAQAAPPTLALPDFTEIIARTEASVVNIRTTETVRTRRPGRPGPGGDPYELFRWFFGPDFAPPGAPPGPRRNVPPPRSEERAVPRGVGSGFIISDDGYILTNNHVVDRASDIFVTLTNGKEYKAKVVGTDPRTDVALIKVDDVENLKALPIGDSNQLRKGHWVLAIGSPFGLESTVTAGIVSAINRDTGDYLPFIQTDVAVNPGNSGGPLLNLSGEVVGINSQIVSRSGGFMGISLAIPIDEAMRIVAQLRADGKVTRGRIGVQIGQISEDVARALGLEKAQGALVSMVEQDGPAAKAGVQSGDVITHFDDKPINQMSDLPRIVGGTKPGTKSTLTVWRKGKSVKLSVEVAEMPTTTDTAASTAEPQTADADALGLSVIDVPQDVREKQRIQGGVQVERVEDPAAGAGILEGDIILAVNNTDVANAAQFARVVADLSKSRAAALLVMRGDQSQWITVTPK